MSSVSLLTYFSHEKIEQEKYLFENDWHLCAVDEHCLLSVLVAPPGREWRMGSPEGRGVYRGSFGQFIEEWD